MNLPPPPPVFRAPSHDDRVWWWRLEDDTGAEVAAGEEWSGQRFPSQAEAESWVGEVWADLAELGVEAVTLFEADRRVYGPMSLRP